MPKYKLTEGEARLLVAMFEHLKPYDERAKAKNTSVADEMNSAGGKILDTYYELLDMAMIVRLSIRERSIIKKRFGLSEDRKCYTREEIAPEFGVTRERIRQAEDKALKKIKQYMTELNEYETYMATCILEDKAQEHLEHSMEADDQGDTVSENVYGYDWIVCTDVKNKLAIQQEIRRFREKR